MIIHLPFKEVRVKSMKGKIRDFLIALTWHTFLPKETRIESDAIFSFNKFSVNLHSSSILSLGYFQVVSDSKVIAFL